MVPISLLVLLAVVFPVSACAGPADTLQLELERAVWLESRGALNLSGLTLGGDGYLYFTDDNGPAAIDWQPQNPVLLRIRVDSVVDRAIEYPCLEALEVEGDMAFAQIAESGGKAHKFDFEGVAAAGGGKLWVVDERDRLLLEYDPASRALKKIAGYRELAAWHERLSRGGINNGFEGIALTGRWLFLAHEMYPNLIVRYGLGKDGGMAAEKVIEIAGSSDITGLESSDGALYALGRTGSMVYKIDPESGEVVSAATFRREGDDSRYRYRQRMEHYRNSEGLAVGGGRIFIVLDGNFQSSLVNDNQRQPLLLIYRRPEGF